MRRAHGKTLDVARHAARWHAVDVRAADLFPVIAYRVPAWPW